MNRFMPLVVLALVLAGACSDEVAVPADGPTVDVADGEIVIPQSSITALANGYSFTTDLDISTSEEDLTVHFEGAFQAPDKIEGTMRVSGGPYSELGDFEVIVIGEDVWWNLDGEWQKSVWGADSVHPLVMFSNYATPRFYLEALRFETLALPLSGPPESVNGMEAFPVRLDRQGIISVMEQGTELKRYPEAWAEYFPAGPGIGRNAEQVLPENFTVEIWFVKEGGIPTRILVSYDISEADSAALSFGLGSSLSLHLQMDITDVNTDIQIEPPIPIPTDVPTPTTPPGELTGAEQSRIMEIASSDPRIREMRAGGMAAVGFADESWHTSNSEVLGGYAYVNFNEPHSYQGNLPSIVYDETETSNPPFIEVETEVQMDGIERLLVLVYLPEERVVQIEVVEAAIPPPRR